MRANRVAVIGAGISGLSAASVCAAAGLEVVVFEKSRGFGGRMATRRVQGLTFDHGAQFFTARGAALSALVETWRAEGSAALWFRDAHVGVPDMTAPARALAANVSVLTERTVNAISHTPSGWALGVAEGIAINEQFDALIIAIPAPQAQALLVSGDFELPLIENVRYAPSWALMAAFEAPLSGLEDQMRPDHGDLSWVARNDTKPGRGEGPTCYVAHATADWSKAHLELDPEVARARLLSSLLSLAGSEAAPRYASAHRWRYAFVEQPIGLPFLWDGEVALGACGDWCLGPRVEAAFESGQQLGREVVRTLAGLA